MSPNTKSITLLFFMSLFFTLPSLVNALEPPAAEGVPGGIVIIPLDENNARATPSAKYKDRNVMVIKDKNQWLAVVGVSLSAKPGTHKINVADTAGSSNSYSFTVLNKDYETQHITIKDKRKVNPNALDMTRITKEKKLITNALAHWNKTLIASALTFDSPVSGPQSSSFGLRRYFNEQPRRPHSGLDIAAPEGTLINAPADAEVILTGDFFFNGNSVFLNHGMGLVTMYAHMSKIDVTQGQKVRRGEKIGEVGMTGRVTGPHLHWGVSLNNARVNPSLFVPALLSNSANQEDSPSN